MTLGDQYQEGVKFALAALGLDPAKLNGADRLVKLLNQDSDHYSSQMSDRPTKKLERNSIWSAPSALEGTYGWGSGMAAPGGL
jgi:hypothetical protein